MAGYAVTNKGMKISICANPQNGVPLNQAAFAALTYVAIGKVGNRGDLGPDTNIVNYPTLDTSVQYKQKGITDAGDFEIEVAYAAQDPGQLLLRAAALTPWNYAFKIEFNDAPSGVSAGTVVYNAGIVTGPVRGGGGNEDFIVETFTVGFNQLEVVIPVAS